MAAAFASRVVAGASLALGGAFAASAQQVSIGTSNPGSIYHSSGTVIAKLLNEKGGVRATIQPYASPNVFIPSVNAGEMQLGLANIAEIGWPLAGEEPFQARPHQGLCG